MKLLPRALFVCIHNAGRSQMAQAFWEQLGGVGHSAGSDPAVTVNPLVVEAMLEAGIDLSGRDPKHLDDADAQAADLIVTMGCGDACPYLPGKAYVDWDIEDPAGAPLETVRRVRDDVRQRVNALARAYITEQPETLLR